MFNETGIPGPSSVTDFEVADGGWTREYVELQKRCMAVMFFLQEHPDIVAKVEISKNKISSVLSDVTECE